MKTSINVPNLRVIKCSYVPPTDTRGSMIKLWETKRYNDQKTQSKTFSIDYKIGNVLDQAISILDKNGWNIVCKGSEFNHYYILCDNWGEDFKEIKDLK